MRLPRPRGWPSGLRGIGSRPAEARQLRDSGGKRTESGEDFLPGPFGGVGVDGARSFFCISSRSSRSYIILHDRWSPGLGVC